MLKVIAEHFIKPEAVDTVLPLYRELVEKTRQEPLCISYELFTDQSDPHTSPSSRPGRTGPRWTSTAPRSTSPVWCRSSPRTSVRKAG